MMSKHLIAVLALSLSNIACSAEVNQTPPAPASNASPTPTPSVPKKVCIKVFDAKQNKEVEKCRTLKLHQKHEGTAVPDKK